MATTAFGSSTRDDTPAADHRFAATMATVMAVVVVAGFSAQFLAGRSSFDAPLRVHVHAAVFMGWTALFLVQSWLATRGPLALHRTLGWIAAGWTVLMVAAGFTVMLATVRNGTTPFFFLPQHFLIANPLTLLGFAGLTWAAITLRRRTDWHSRLHVCAMTMIMGPAFGRLLPMPLLIPHAFEAVVLASVVFPIAGMIRDKRALGKVHPAWWVGLATLALALVVADRLTWSPLGGSIYAAAVAGTPGAAIPGLEFPPPPPAPLPGGR